ncbi:32 kDa beta-galactoside-binding lectin lec-3 isoform X2 [Helicoverpa armigera]|uniref:32 kDa beta-galactoside-binding lectin lec-3 isoform X2 n=1 Tax=Helicoverpa armigera TaxID=29058 RepID=UPI003083A506
MISIYDHDLPCVHKIAVDITNGSKIRIQGSIPRDAHRFDEMEIVRNTFTAGAWGKEERRGGMPLCRGDPFDMLIECDEVSFMVSINGQHFCKYIHRIPYDRITHLVVFGDVKIIKCNIDAPSHDLVSFIMCVASLFLKG